MQTPRRDLLLASMMAALPTALATSLAGRAAASPLDPAQTFIDPPSDFAWVTPAGYPERSTERCQLAGVTEEPGLYYELVRWWPGAMSAPHSYGTDRYCVVVSGTWWCNSGADFDPAACQPARPGSFVWRVKNTPHYDGVPRNGTEPAVVAICGTGPAGHRLVDASQPGWRSV